MSFFTYRVRKWVIVTIAILASIIAIIGITRAVNPEFNLIEMIGFGENDAIGSSRTKPYWSQLTDTEKTFLAPLEKCWDKISSARKKKWRQIAKRMEKMSPEERGRLHERIQIWVNLTPQQRKEARQNYLNAKKLGIKDKSLQWLEYQNLPEQEKSKFVAKARKKRRIVETNVKKDDTQMLQLESSKEKNTPVKEEIPEHWR